jgi:hypothetical protein
MGYLDNRKQRFRNDLYKNLYNDETSIHVHFTEGGIISWGVGVGIKEETPNATQRTSKHDKELFFKRNLLS